MKWPSASRPVNCDGLPHQAMPPVVSVVGHLPAAIDDLRQVAAQVVGVSVAVTQRVGPRGDPIHAVVGVRRLAVLRVGHAQHVAVAVVRPRRAAPAGIHDPQRLIQRRNAQSPCQ